MSRQWLMKTRLNDVWHRQSKQWLVMIKYLWGYLNPIEDFKKAAILY